MSSDVNVPVAVRLLIVGLAAKPISIWLSVTVVASWFVVPLKVTVSPPANESAEPLSAASVKPVARDTVEAAVTRPFASTVNTGIVVLVP